MSRYNRPGRKATGAEQVKRAPKTALRAVSGPAEVEPLPPPPGLLKRSQELWEAYWQSDVARALDPNGDTGILYRWISYYDEWLRAQRALRKADRLVPGSMGQLRLNPLIDYIDKLERNLVRAEKELGLTPLARASLALEGGSAQVTLAKLNEMIAQAPPALEVVDGDGDTAEDEGFRALP